MARRRVDIGHAALLAFLLSVVLWYLFDAVTASTRIENLIFIVPASTIAVILCIVVGMSLFSPTAKDKSSDSDAGGTRKVFLMIALFAAFVLTMDTLGFDIATAVFVASSLAVLGERRIWFLVVYSIVFTVGVSLTFRFLLPYPMPMTLL